MKTITQDNTRSVSKHYVFTSHQDFTGQVVFNWLPRSPKLAIYVITKTRAQKKNPATGEGAG